MRTHGLLNLLAISLLVLGCTEINGAAGLGAGIDASGQGTGTSPWGVEDSSSQSTPTGEEGGDFEEPCTDNEDCSSGYCIEGPEGISVPSSAVINVPKATAVVAYLIRGVTRSSSASPRLFSTVAPV